MNCDEALLAISAALDGELSPGERRKLSEHLLECGSCRELAEDLRVLTEELGRSDREAPPGLADAILRAVAEEAQASPTPKRRRAPYLSAAAAMLALCIGLGGIGLFASRHVSGGSNLSSAPTLYRSAPEGKEYAGSTAPETAEDSDGCTGAAVTAGSAEAPMEAAQSAPEEDVPMPSTMPSSTPAAAEDRSKYVQDSPGSSRNDQTSPESDYSGESGPSSDNCEEIALAPDNEDGFTPEEALELVFLHLGGYEAYPEAKQLPEDGTATGFYLKTVEGGQVSSDYYLDYQGLYTDGQSYRFRLYEEVTEEGTDTSDHQASINWFIVSPDGGITAEFPQ